MNSKYRHCYLYLVIGVLLTSFLIFIGLRVSPVPFQVVLRESPCSCDPNPLQWQVQNDSDHSVQEQPGESGQAQGHSRRLVAMPVMGTLHPDASRATLLNCTEGKPRGMSTPAAGETLDPLHECTVCVCVCLHNNIFISRYAP